MELSERTSEILLDAACNVIQTRLGGAPRPIVFGDDPAMAQPAGCFVSIHRRDTHALRGCIGLLESERPLSATLVSAAQGVLNDPRFTHQPVTLEELQQLDIEVTVLGPMQPAASPLDFDPNLHGIYLTIGQRTGCFLPQVGRENGWTREYLLSRLCIEKLGLDALAWKDASAKLRIFTAQVIGPRPFFPPSSS